MRCIFLEDFLPNRVWDISAANVGLQKRSVKLTTVDDSASFGIESANIVLTGSEKHELCATRRSVDQWFCIKLFEWIHGHLP